MSDGLRCEMHLQNNIKIRLANERGQRRSFRTISSYKTYIANIWNVELGRSSQCQGGVRRHGVETTALSSSLAASNVENIIANRNWCCKFCHDARILYW